MGAGVGAGAVTSAERMLAAAQAWVVLAATFLAARAILRRRVVFLLGRRGPLVAPGVLASLWLAGFLLGQVTGSILGMVYVAAAVLVGAAALVRRRFAPRRAPHHVLTRIDLAILAYFVFLFLFVGLWDFDTRRIMVAQLLHGNVPPVALNDPRVLMTYHPIYDAMTAVVMTALPLDLEPSMAIVSIGCVFVTLANLRAITRLLFDSPSAAQLGRVLFAFGYGPMFVRYLLLGRDVDVLHGSTSQVYADIILRRPAGVGLAFFTLALALILPLYRGRARARAAGAPPGSSALPAPAPRGGRYALRAAIFVLPTCALLPQLAEETVLFLVVLLLPLLVVRRLPPGLVAAMALFGAVGVLRAGVLQGVLGLTHTMAAPHPHLTWPPTLPSWREPENGIAWRSRDGLIFFLVELGPVFLATLGLAVAGGFGGRGRILAAIFLAGLIVASIVKPLGWVKADLDRFLFYGTPSIFMLSAGWLDRLWSWLARRRAAWPAGARRPLVVATASAFAVLVCAAPLVYPTSHAASNLVDSFDRHELRGDLARNLRIVGRRDLVLTTRARADDLLRAGFLIVAPFETSSVVGVTDDHFDDYVRQNAGRATWQFLPEDDPRVAGRPVAARDGGYVLVRAAPGASPPKMGSPTGPR